MTRTLYDVVASSAQEAYVIITRHGEGTEFEAVSRIEMDQETCTWDGYLLFKDPRFSPGEADFPTLGLQYQTPRGASGVVAVTRAKNYYAQLVGIFTALMKGGVNHD